MADNTGNQDSKILVGLAIDPRETSRLYSQIANIAARVPPVRLKFQNQGVLGTMAKDASEFERSLGAASSRVLSFGATAGVLYSVSAAFTALVKSTIDVEKQLKDINVVLGLSTSGLQGLSKDLFKVASDTGQAFNVASKAALEFSRQGLSVEQTLKRTKDALILTRLSGLDVAQSVETITAALNGFNDATLTSAILINKLATVDAAFAVSTADLAEAFTRVGSTASDAGVSLDSLIAIVTSAQQSTARGGSVIGNSLKTIFQRVTRSTTLDTLKQFNVEVQDLQGNILPADRILINLAKSFKGASVEQQNFITQLAAGVFQSNQFRAILNDLSKESSVYSRALATSSNATDQAAKRNAELNKTLSSSIQEIKNRFAELGATVGNLTIKTPVDAFAKVFKTLDDGLKSGNNVGVEAGSTIGTGILKGLGDYLAGPGAATAVVLAAKLFLNFGGFAAKAFGRILENNTKEFQVRQAINNLLAQSEGLGEKIRAGGLNQLQIQEAILATLKGQSIEYARQGQIVAATKTLAAAGNIRLQNDKYVLTPKTKAVGHVPAAQERAGAYAGGYTPGAIKEMNIPALGRVVYNTAEKVRKFPGLSQPAIMPPQNSRAGINYKKDFAKSHGFDPYKNEGLVPNFIPTGILKGFRQTRNDLKSGQFRIQDTVSKYGDFKEKGYNVSRPQGLYDPKTKDIVLDNAFVGGLYNYQNTLGNVISVLAHEGTHKTIDLAGLSKKLAKESPGVLSNLKYKKLVPTYERIKEAGYKESSFLEEALADGSLRSEYGRKALQSNLGLSDKQTKTINRLYNRLLDAAQQGTDVRRLSGGLVPNFASNFIGPINKPPIFQLKDLFGKYKKAKTYSDEQYGYMNQFEKLSKELGFSGGTGSDFEGSLQYNGATSSSDFSKRYPQERLDKLGVSKERLAKLLGKALTSTNNPNAPANGMNQIRMGLFGTTQKDKLNSFQEKFESEKQISAVLSRLRKAFPEAPINTKLGSYDRLYANSALKEAKKGPGSEIGYSLFNVMGRISQDRPLYKTDYGSGVLPFKGIFNDEEVYKGNEYKFSLTKKQFDQRRKKLISIFGVGGKKFQESVSSYLPSSRNIIKNDFYLPSGKGVSSFDELLEAGKGRNLIAQRLSAHNKDVKLANLLGYNTENFPDKKDIIKGTSPVGFRANLARSLKEINFVAENSKQGSRSSAQSSTYKYLFSTANSTANPTDFLKKVSGNLSTILDDNTESNNLSPRLLARAYNLGSSSYKDERVFTPAKEKTPEYAKMAAAFRKFKKFKRSTIETSLGRGQNLPTKYNVFNSNITPVNAFEITRRSLRPENFEILKDLEKLYSGDILSSELVFRGQSPVELALLDKLGAVTSPGNRTDEKKFGQYVSSSVLKTAGYAISSPFRGRPGAVGIYRREALGALDYNVPANERGNSARTPRINKSALLGVLDIERGRVLKIGDYLKQFGRNGIELPEEVLNYNRELNQQNITGLLQRPSQQLLSDLTGDDTLDLYRKITTRGQTPNTKGFRGPSSFANNPERFESFGANDFVDYLNNSISSTQSGIIPFGSGGSTVFDLRQYRPVSRGFRKAVDSGRIDISRFSEVIYNKKVPTNSLITPEKLERIVSLSPEAKRAVFRRGMTFDLPAFRSGQKIGTSYSDEREYPFFTTSNGVSNIGSLFAVSKGGNLPYQKKSGVKSSNDPYSEPYGVSGGLVPNFNIFSSLGGLGAKMLPKQNLPANIPDEELEKIYQQYASAFYDPAKNKTPIGLNLFANKAFNSSYVEKKGNYIFGQHDDKVFLPTHFAPKSKLGGLSMIKDLKEYDNIVFAVTQDLSKLLQKTGYGVLKGNVPVKFRDGEAMKDILASNMIRTPLLASSMFASLATGNAKEYFEKHGGRIDKSQRSIYYGEQGRGYNAVEYMKQKGLIKAGGLVPNFNSYPALKQAIQRENKAGIPISQIRVGNSPVLKSSSNPNGLGVYNTQDEPLGLNQGIQRAVSMGLNPKTHGVPNFANGDTFGGTFGVSQKGQLSFLELKELNKDVGVYRSLLKSGVGGQKELNFATIELANKYELTKDAMEKVANTFKSDLYSRAFSAPITNPARLLDSKENNKSRIEKRIQDLVGRANTITQKQPRSVFLDENLEKRRVTPLQGPRDSDFEKNRVRQQARNFRFQEYQGRSYGSSFDLVGDQLAPIELSQSQKRRAAIRQQKIEEIRKKNEEIKKSQTLDLAPGTFGPSRSEFDREQQLKRFSQQEQQTKERPFRQFERFTTSGRASELSRVELAQELKNLRKEGRGLPEQLRKEYLRGIKDFTKRETASRELSGLQASAGKFGGLGMLFSSKSREDFNKLKGVNPDAARDITSSLQNKAFIASIAAPVLAGIAQQSIGTETRGQRGAGAIAGALGNAAGFASLGGTFAGPVGAAVGGIGGLLVELPNIFKAFSDTLPDLQKRFGELQDTTQKTSSGLESFISSSEKLSESIKNGGITANQLNSFRRERINSLAGIPNVDGRGRVRELVQGGQFTDAREVAGNISFNLAQKQNLLSTELEFSRLKKGFSILSGDFDTKSLSETDKGLFKNIQKNLNIIDFNKKSTGFGTERRLKENETLKLEAQRQGENFFKESDLSQGFRQATAGLLTSSDLQGKRFSDILTQNGDFTKDSTSVEGIAGQIKTTFQKAGVDKSAQSLVDTFSETLVSAAKTFKGTELEKPFLNFIKETLDLDGIKSIIDGEKIIEGTAIKSRNAIVLLNKFLDDSRKKFEELGTAIQISGIKNLSNLTSSLKTGEIEQKGRNQFGLLRGGGEGLRNLFDFQEGQTANQNRAKIETRRLEITSTSQTSSSLEQYRAELIRSAQQDLEKLFKDTPKELVDKIKNFQSDFDKLFNPLSENLKDGGTISQEQIQQFVSLGEQRRDLFEKIQRTGGLSAGVREFTAQRQKEIGEGPINPSDISSFIEKTYPGAFNEDDKKFVSSKTPQQLQEYAAQAENGAKTTKDFLDRLSEINKDYATKTVEIQKELESSNKELLAQFNQNVKLLGEQRAISLENARRTGAFNVNQSARQFSLSQSSLGLGFRGRNEIETRKQFESSAGNLIGGAIGGPEFNGLINENTRAGDIDKLLKEQEGRVRTAQISATFSGDAGEEANLKKEQDVLFAIQGLKENLNNLDNDRIESLRQANVEDEKNLRLLSGRLAEIQKINDGLIRQGEFGKITKKLGGDFSESLSFTSTDFYKTLSDDNLQFAQEFKQTFKDGFAEAATGASKFSDALRGIGISIGKNILTKASNLATDQLFGALFGKESNLLGGNAGIFSSVLSSFSGGKANGGIIKKYAYGGYVNQGSGVKDDVPALLSGGEFVIKKSSTQRLGKNFLNSLNKGGSVRGFADGGFNYNFANEYAGVGDKKRPTYGYANISPLLSDIALNDDNNPQNALRLRREQYFKDLNDYNLNNAAILKNFEKQQTSRRIGAYVSAGINVASAGIGKAGSNYKNYGQLSNPHNASYLTGKANGGLIKNYANGGSIFGGNDIKDTIPAYLMGGEFVFNKNATNRIGKNNLEYMNKTGKIPGFAMGGYVGNSTPTGGTDVNSFSKYLSDSLSVLSDIKNSLSGKTGEANSQSSQSQAGGISISSSIVVYMSESGTKATSTTETSGDDKDKNSKEKQAQGKEIGAMVVSLINQTLEKESKPGGKLYDKFVRK